MLYLDGILPVMMNRSKNHKRQGQSHHKDRGLGQSHRHADQGLDPGQGLEREVDQDQDLTAKGTEVEVDTDLIPVRERKTTEDQAEITGGGQGQDRGQGHGAEIGLTTGDGVTNRECSGFIEEIRLLTLSGVEEVGEDLTMIEGQDSGLEGEVEGAILGSNIRIHFSEGQGHGQQVLNQAIHRAISHRANSHLRKSPTMTQKSRCHRNLNGPVNRVAQTQRVKQGRSYQSPRQKVL